MPRYPEGSKIIHLTGGYTALVDAHLHDFLSSFSWYAHYSRSSVYARTTIGGKKVLMHVLLSYDHPGVGYHVDHIDHNTLNNMKRNLRVVTVRENMNNRRRRRSYSNAV